MAEAPQGHPLVLERIGAVARLHPRWRTPWGAIALAAQPRSNDINTAASP